MIPKKIEEKLLEDYINLKNKEYEKKQLGYFIKALDELFEEIC